MHQVLLLEVIDSKNDGVGIYKLIIMSNNYLSTAL